MAAGSQPMPDLGLVRVPTELLRELLRFVHRGQVACPLTPAQLAPLGLQAESERIMGALRGLDDRATRALLTAVLAERQAQGG